MICELCDEEAVYFGHETSRWTATTPPHRYCFYHGKVAYKDFIVLDLQELPALKAWQQRQRQGHIATDADKTNPLFLFDA